MRNQEEMEKILEQLFIQNGIEVPIRKVLLTRNGYIDYPGNMYGVQFIDKRKFPDWMQQLKRSVSPMKHMQIRAAQTILNTVQTTSFHRDIWNTENKEDRSYILAMVVSDMFYLDAMNISLMIRMQ